MLVALRVRNVGPFEEATLDVGPGFTVLTGETGAGKTLLVEALHLVLGGTDRSLPPRDAGKPTLVEATFDLDGDELVAGRERSPQGRLRALLDGVTTSAKLLAERTAECCELHGQHEHQVLRRPGAARRLLDATAGVDDGELRGLRRARRDLLAERERLGGSAVERRRRLELLEHERAEIDAAAPSGAEELDELVAEAATLAALLEARDGIAAAIAALDGDGDGPDAATLVASARAELPRALDGPREALGGLLERLREVAAGLRRDLDRVGEDPERLAAVNARIDLLQDLVRKHGRTLADVLARRAGLEAELDVLASEERRAATLDGELAGIEAAIAQVSASVRAARTSAARSLTDAVSKRLAGLALGHATFQVDVSGEAGEDVVFLFSGVRGLAPVPLADAASGGELSRVMLALTLATRGGGGCVVFDEVDAGIGGATSLALAACLRELADREQVLVVTHLATVAAAADRHLVVRSRDGDAVVEQVDGDARVAELARMLGGDESEARGLEHARALLERHPA